MNNYYPSTLEDHIGYWLRCLSNYVHNSFAAKLAEHNVSVAQWVVLRSLYDAKNMTLSRASEIIGLDKSSLSRMIERLVQKELVVRANGKDRRSVSLSLTEQAIILVPELAKLADENDKAFFSIISDEQQKELLNIIKQLLQVNGWNSTTHGKDKIE